MGIGKLALETIKVAKYVGTGVAFVLAWETARRTANYVKDRKPAAAPVAKSQP